MPAQTNGITARKPRSRKRIDKKQPAKKELPGAKNVARKGRQPNGTFAPGNSFGPGNPHARHCARMLALFRSCVSDQDMVAIIRALVDKAAKGDTSAAKILFSYTIGKPETAPNPDQIDRDEWEHYQKNTINLQEMQQILSSLPAKVGNDIVRTGLPIMTEARATELAAQLRQSCPIPEEVIEITPDASTEAKQSPPLPNGKTSKIDSRSTLHASRSTPSPRTTNDNRPTTIDSRSTYHASRSTPGPRTTNDDRPTTIDSRAILHASRSTPGSRTTNDHRPTTIDSRSTIHTPPATNSQPIANGKSKNQTNGKRKRKLVRKQWLRTVAKRLKS